MNSSKSKPLDRAIQSVRNKRTRSPRHARAYWANWPTGGSPPTRHPVIPVPMEPFRRNLDRKVKTALNLVRNPACVPHIAKKSFLFGKLDRKDST